MTSESKSTRLWLIHTIPWNAFFIAVLAGTLLDGLGFVSAYWGVVLFAGIGSVCITALTYGLSKMNLLAATIYSVVLSGVNFLAVVIPSLEVALGLANSGDGQAAFNVFIPILVWPLSLGCALFVAVILYFLPARRT